MDNANRESITLTYCQTEQELYMLKRLQSQVESRIKRHNCQTAAFIRSDEGCAVAKINNDNKILYARLIKSTEERMDAGAQALVRQILRDEQTAKEN